MEKTIEKTMEEFETWLWIQENTVKTDDKLRELQLSCVSSAIAEFNLHNINNGSS